MDRAPHEEQQEGQPECRQKQHRDFDRTAEAGAHGGCGAPCAAAQGDDQEAGLRHDERAGGDPEDRVTEEIGKMHGRARGRWAALDADESRTGTATLSTLLPAVNRQSGGDPAGREASRGRPRPVRRAPQFMQGETPDRNAWRRRERPRWMRDMTVPSGTLRRSAASW